MSPARTDQSRFLLPGAVTNPMPWSPSPGLLRPVRLEVRVRVPSRIDTFLVHHDVFVQPPRPQVYPVGAVAFAVPEYSQVVARLVPGESDVVIHGTRSKELLLKHTGHILMKALRRNARVELVVERECRITHAGLGSSAALQLAAAVAIDALFGSQIPRRLLIKYLAQNYGEDSGDGRHLTPMPSIGCGAALGLLGGVAVVMDEAEVVARAEVPAGFSLLLAVPRLNLPGGAQDYYLFERNAGRMLALGRTWGSTKDHVARRVLGPALLRGDLGPLLVSLSAYTLGAYGDIAGYFGHRWGHSGVRYDLLLRGLARELLPDGPSPDRALFVSSGGPALAFIIRARIDSPAVAAARECFRRNGVLETHVLSFDNSGATIEFPAGA